MTSPFPTTSLLAAAGTPIRTRPFRRGLCSTKSRSRPWPCCIGKVNYWTGEETQEFERVCPGGRLPVCGGLGQRRWPELALHAAGIGLATR